MGRIIRLFISSTFQDFYDERDILMKEVFLDLQEQCRKEGFSFQVLDLRWGIPEQAALNQETLKICLDEIAHCQRLSPNVNFLLMVGERAGWHPLPPAIDADEWEMLMQALDECAGADIEGIFRKRFVPEKVRKLLNTWYVKDENDLAGRYHLRRREGIYAENREAFGIIEKKLQEVLAILAGKAGISGSRLGKYHYSATAQEIIRGLLRDPGQLRDKTFAMFQDDPQTREDEQSRRECRILREQVRRSLPPEQIHTYQAGDTAYVDAVRAFLQEKVREEIALSRSLTGFEEARENEQEELRTLSRGYCSRPETEKQFRAFLDENPGKVLLLTGPSGGGKSWLVRHQLLADESSGETERRCACVFTDIQPSCRTMRQIYAYLLTQLGLETGTIPAGNGHLMEWFEASLSPLREREGRYWLFVDCVEGIEDWRDQADSPLTAKLPENVTMVISAIDPGSLREQERLLPVGTYTLPALKQGESCRQIMEHLRRAGRTLTEKQQTQLLSSLPSEPLPLHTAILAGRLISQSSMADFPAPEAVGSLEGTIKFLYFRIGEIEYTVLRQHILGYFALAKVGLSEQELLKLLSRDDEVISEIRRLHPAWNESMDKVLRYTFPSALWARIYYEILPVLAEIRQDGGIILTLRHSRLREAVLKILGRGILLTLAENMRRYFSDEKEQPWFWLSADKAILPNRRRFDELMESVRFLGDEEREAAILSDVRYADCGVRLGRLFFLIRDYSRMLRGIRQRAAGMHAASAEVYRQILSILQKKQELLRMYPDQFLPAAVSAGLAAPGILRGSLIPGYFTGSGKRPSAGRYHFHQMEHGRMALREDGVLAVFSEGLIQLADLRDGIALDVYCRVPMKQGWIYWIGDQLCVRDEGRRALITYTGSELFVNSVVPAVPYNEVKAPGDGSAQDTAYGWGDYEAMLSVYYRTFMFRSSRGGRKVTLHYSDDSSPRVTLRSHIACVETNGRQVDIVDLEKGCMLGETRQYYAVDDVVISEHGQYVLIRLLDGSLRLVDTAKLPSGKDVDLSNDEADVSMTGTWGMLKDLGKTLFRMTKSILNTDISVKDGFTTVHRGDSEKGTDHLPQKLVFSMAYRYSAAYYRRGGESSLIFYELNEAARRGEAIWEINNIPEMYESDRVQLPMFTFCGGRMVALLLGGTWHIYDIVTKKHYSAAEKPQMDAEVFPAARKIGDAHADDVMAFQLQAEERTSSRMSDVSGIDGRNALGKWSDKALDSALDSLRKLIFKGERKTWTPDMFYAELRNLPIVPDAERKRLWLIDPIYDMIHLYDLNGKCLCRDQLDMKVTWADVDDKGNLIIISGDRGTTEVRSFTAAV